MFLSRHEVIGIFDDVMLHINEAGIFEFSVEFFETLAIDILVGFGGDNDS